MYEDLLLWIRISYLPFSHEQTDGQREREGERKREKHEMKLVIGVVLLPKLQKVNP